MNWKEVQKQRKDYIDEHKKQCKKCGCAHEKKKLSFHHLFPQDKLFKISCSERKHYLSTIKREIAKCVVLCLDCHSKIHERT